MSNIVRFDAVRSVPFGSITNTYAQLGIPLEHPMRLLHFINGTDGDVMMSFDGTTNNFPVLADSFALYDLTSNQDTTESFRYEKGTKLYIKYISVPTTGTFYIVAVYGKGE